MSEKSDKDDYEVGYGKPPKHTRFKPGQSGNPGGRPKQERSVDLSPELIQDKFLTAALRLVPITQKGKRREVPAIEAVMHQLVAKAAAGDMRAIRLLLEETERHLNERFDTWFEFYQMIVRGEEEKERKFKEERFQASLRKAARERKSGG